MHKSRMSLLGVFVFGEETRRDRGVFTCNCCPYCVLAVFLSQIEVALVNCFPLKGYCYRCNVKLSIGYDICGCCR